MMKPKEEELKFDEDEDDETLFVGRLDWVDEIIVLETLFVGIKEEEGEEFDAERGNFDGA